MDRFTEGIAHVVTVDLVEPMAKATSTHSAQCAMQERLESDGFEFVEWIGWHASQVMLTEGGDAIRYIGKARVQG